MGLTRREVLYEQERALALRRLERCLEILHQARLRGSEAGAFRDEVNTLITKYEQCSVEAELCDLEDRFQAFLTGMAMAA